MISKLEKTRQYVIYWKVNTRKKLQTNIPAGVFGIAECSVPQPLTFGTKNTQMSFPSSSKCSKSKKRKMP